MFTTLCQQHTKRVSLEKAVSAIPVGLKYETRYRCYSHLQRDSLIVSIMEDILRQLMMSVTVYGAGGVVQICIPIHFSTAFRSCFTKYERSLSIQKKNVYTFCVTSAYVKL